MCIWEIHLLVIYAVNRHIYRFILQKVFSENLLSLSKVCVSSPKWMNFQKVSEGGGGRGGSFPIQKISLQFFCIGMEGSLPIKENYCNFFEEGGFKAVLEIFRNVICFGEDGRPKIFFFRKVFSFQKHLVSPENIKICRKCSVFPQNICISDSRINHRFCLKEANVSQLYRRLMKKRKNVCVKK